MTIQYTFSAGSTYVKSMKIYQSPWNWHLSGMFTIKYWDGSAFVEVSNPSRTSFTNADQRSSNVHLSSQAIYDSNGVESMVHVEFDMVFSDKYQIILYPDDNSREDNAPRV